MDGREGEMASPAFGGGGTDDCAAGAVGCGTAPGCGAGGEKADVAVVAVGRVVVGVAVRLPGWATVVAVGAGRLGVAPGWAGGFSGCAAA